MNRRELIIWINELEHKFSINDWKINDLHIWPILRIQLAFYFYNKEIARKTSIQSKVGLLRTFISSLKIAFKGLVDLSRLYFSHKGKGICLMSAHVNHRADVDGLSYNKFFDPLLDELEKQNFKGCLIESSSNQKVSGKIYKYNRRYSWESIIKVYNLFNSSKQNRIRVEIDNNEYNKFLAELIVKDENLDKIFKLELQIKSFTALKRQCDVCTFLLNIIKPKYILIACYYDNIHLALNWASNNLKIPTIDVQHGVQGDWHVSYGNWSNIPQEGYAALPKVFWNWDDNSYQAIKKWLVNQKVHTALIGGNPWVEAWKTNKLTIKNKKLFSFNEVKYYILYSLQPIDNDVLFSQFLLECIRISDLAWKWCIRVHPRQTKGEIDQIVNRLKEYDVYDRVEFEASSKFPLPALLNNVHLHITHWSSVAIEAAYFSINTIFLHHNGEVLKDLIPKNHFNIYTNSIPEELISIMQRKLIRYNVITNNDEALYVKALQQLDN